MIVLCSSSPRRKELFRALNLEFITQPANVDESHFTHETVLEYLQRITISKAKPEPTSPNELRISSDTIVVLENAIFQKPNSFEEAMNMLEQLNGKTHLVYSGICFLTSELEIFEHETTEVTFQNFTKSELENYILTCKPYDKAGSYGIQDKPSLVQKISGSYTNILGFPIRTFFKHHELWSRFNNENR